MSPDLFHPEPFHPYTTPYTVFNSQVSRAQFGGDDIFSGPSGVCTFRYIDATNSENSQDFLFVTDRNWDRVVYSGIPLDGSSQWIRSCGNHGIGLYSFNNPTAIDMVGFKLFVADGYNNRVLAYEPDQLYGFPMYRFTISRGFDYVPDIACAWIPPRSDWSSIPAEVAVIDQGNLKIDIFDELGAYKRTIGGSDFGTYALQRPTAIAYGRNIVDNFATSYVYVCDAAARRVVAKSTNPNQTAVYSTALTDFPADAYLTSIDCDWFGYVYVLDSKNGQVHVFDPALSEHVAQYGSKGKGPGELWYPRGVAHQFGWRRHGDGTIEPLSEGGFAISELWGDSTGVRRYLQNFDVTSIAFNYHKVPDSVLGGVDQLFINWNQTGPTYSTVLLFDDFEDFYGYYYLYDTSFHPIATLSDSALVLPGYHWVSYLFPNPPNLDQPATETYYVVLHSRGVYSHVEKNQVGSFQFDRGYEPCQGQEDPLVVTSAAIVDLAAC